MCFALFIAASSIFLARQQLFPAILQRTGVFYFLSFLPLLLMIFWMLRVRFTNAFKSKVAAKLAPLVEPPVKTEHIRIDQPAGTAARI
jgi:hypothetical protein